MHKITLDFILLKLNYMLTNKVKKTLCSETCLLIFKQASGSQKIFLN